MDDPDGVRPSALPIPAPAPCVQPRARPLFCTVRCLRRQPSLSTVFPASLGLDHDEGGERAIATVLPTTQEHHRMLASIEERRSRSNSLDLSAPLHRHTAAAGIAAGDHGAESTFG